MHCVKRITDDLLWVGCISKKVSLFEGAYPVPDGMAYNSYALFDEKVVLFDTADKSVATNYLENLQYAFRDRQPDYLVVSHMEPDHCSLISEIVLRYPSVTIVCNAKTQAMIKQFFDFDVDSRIHIVNDGDVLTTGRHKLHFVFAPMVHWPEVMVTYDETDKILFSADAFGTFGAPDGQLFDTQVDENAWLDEMRRYYANIVGKYGAQVQALLKKASALEIKTACPLHGFIWTEKLPFVLAQYDAWSAYRPTEKGVLLIYASIYGNTQSAANVLAAKLAEKGIKVKIYDVSMTHPSYIIGDAFKYSHIVAASPTYNNEIFTRMENVLNDFKAHNVQNRTVAVMENGSWAPCAGKKMKDIFAQMKNVTVLDATVTIRSSLKEEQLGQIDILAEEIAKTI